MLMLSGQRRNEVAGMVWSELDLERERIWIIPAARMKAELLAARVRTLLFNRLRAQAAASRTAAGKAANRKPAAAGEGAK